MQRSVIALGTLLGAVCKAWRREAYFVFQQDAWQRGIIMRPNQCLTLVSDSAVPILLNKEEAAISLRPPIWLLAASSYQYQEFSLSTVLCFWKRIFFHRGQGSSSEMSTLMIFIYSLFIWSELQATEPLEQLLKCCIVAQEDTMTRRNKFYLYQELEAGRTLQNKLLMTAEFWPQK